MNIVICGAGQVGSHAAEVLTPAGHNITVIDQSSARVRRIGDTLDVRTLRGNCASAEVLRDAGCAKADLVVAATSSDEINLLTAVVAKGWGRRVRSCGCITALTLKNADWRIPNTWASTN
jgi:trk system potassium uptake protein TrkA